MRCPHCERVFNVLAFKRLELPEGWETDLTPVYRCPKSAKALGPKGYEGTGGCGYIFAPAEAALTRSMRYGALAHEPTEATHVA
jgi:hypothetical protein